MCSSIMQDLMIHAAFGLKGSGKFALCCLLFCLLICLGCDFSGVEKDQQCKSALPVALTAFSYPVYAGNIYPAHAVPLLI